MVTANNTDHDNAVGSSWHDLSFIAAWRGQNKRTKADKMVLRGSAEPKDKDPMGQVQSHTQIGEENMNSLRSTLRG